MRTKEVRKEEVEMSDTGARDVSVVNFMYFRGSSGYHISHCVQLILRYRVV